jgi:hypothetical protein
MATGHLSDHFIPATLAQVGQFLHERNPDPGVARVRALLIALLRLETGATGDGLKAGFERALDAAQRDRGNRPEAEDPRKAFVADLTETLVRANYRPVTERELNEAVDSKAIFHVKVAVDTRAFRQLHIFVRGKEPREETVRSWFGLRKRGIAFDYLDRVLVFTDGLPPQRRGWRRRRRRPPPPLSIKLFHGIPVPDMEMLLPNSEVRMRRIDQAAVAVPAIVSVTLAASKVILSATAIWSSIQFALGLSKDPPAVSGGWGLVAAGSFTLLGIAMGAYTSYQKRHLQYANAYSETLYYQTLDSGVGAFLRVLDEAFEEEAKEATIAYAFLAEGATTEEALDNDIEGWLGAKVGVEFDFEVDDALTKLQRLGVAVRDGETWRVLPPEQAIAILERRWAASA